MPVAHAFFDIERSYWTERQRGNLLMVHYNDLKADLSSVQVAGDAPILR